MNQENVPQDKENLNEGKLAKLYYATDKEGHYLKVNSIGWEPETVAMQQAWEVVDEEVQAALQKILAGKASPLLYFIKKSIMTNAMVAAHMNSFAFTVALHTKPFFFKRLSRKTLEKYAYTFQVSVDELLDTERLKQHVH